MKLHNLLGPSSIVGLMVSEAVLIVTCFLVAAAALLPVDPIVFALHGGGWTRMLIVIAVFVGGFYLQDLYADLRVKSVAVLTQQVCLVVGLAFLLQAMLNYADISLVFPRWMMVCGSGLALVTIPLWRSAYSRVLTSATHAERVLFVGCNDLARRIERRYGERPELGLVSIGFVTEDGAQPPDGSTKVLGTLAAFREIAEREKPNRIVVALDEPRGQLPQTDLLELRFAGVLVMDAASAFEAAFDRVSLEVLQPSQLIFASEMGPHPRTSQLQALYSSVLAAVGLLVSLPLLVLTSLLVKLTSKGPVLFRQQRVGLNGKVFTLYKFRSMYADAEARTGAVWAQKNDPRITPLGRWIRRFRIDEIPQLFNVLKGEMAIVGPRPERPEFVAELSRQIPYYRQRLAVKPGITGWAQINHKYGDTLEDTVVKLEYDLYYIKNLTPAMDLYVIMHTAKVMLLGRGAQ